MAMRDENGGPFSLIRYEAQIQISENIEEYKKAKNSQKVLDPKPSPEDVLNNMIVPRDWKDQNGKCFMQYVSHSNASRDDVMRLKQSLDDALQYRQARKEGICPIRQELFSEAFNQIVRQVTINCPERGLLLMRVRDEHKMTLAAYQSLYQSSISYGMKKQLQSQQGMDELIENVQICGRKVDELENRKIELISKKESLQKKIMQRKAIEAERKDEELKMIDIQAQELKKFFQSLQNPDEN